MSTHTNGRKPTTRIPSVPPDWADLSEEVNRKEELTQHTFKCVVGLMLLARPPSLSFMLSDYTSKSMPMCHAHDLTKLLEYCYDNSLLVFGCGEDLVLWTEVKKVGKANIKVYLTTEGVKFYSNWLHMRHRTVIGGDIHIGPILTNAILD